MTLENTNLSLKQCNICQRWLEKKAFPLGRARCKECHLARSRELNHTPEQIQKRKEKRANRTPEQKQREYERRQSRKEIDNVRSRELRAQFPDRKARQRLSVWKSTLKHYYGISLEIYQVMYKDQGGRCYFCDERPSSGKVGLAIDHDKDTGFVRGLLCRPCNANFIDEYRKLPEVFRKFQRANHYLRRGETGDYIKSIKQSLTNDDR